MDLEGLSRKELQALCKEHGIKANRKTVVLREEVAKALEAAASAQREAATSPAALALSPVVEARDEEADDSEASEGDGGQMARVELEALPRKQLQAMCKEHGIKANQKTAKLVGALAEIMCPHSPAKSVEPRGMEEEEEAGEPEVATVAVAAPHTAGSGPATPAKSTPMRVHPLSAARRTPRSAMRSAARTPQSGAAAGLDEEEDDDEEDEFGPSEHEVRLNARRASVAAGTPARLAKLAERRRLRQEELKRRAHVLKNAPKITPRRGPALQRASSAPEEAAKVAAGRTSAATAAAAASAPSGAGKRPASAKPLSTSRPGFVPLRSTKPLTVAHEFSLSFKRPRSAAPSVERAGAAGSSARSEAGKCEGGAPAHKRARRPLGARNIAAAVSGPSSAPRAAPEKNPFTFGTAADAGDMENAVVGGAKGGGGFSLGLARRRTGAGGGVAEARRRRAAAARRRTAAPKGASSAPQSREPLDGAAGAWVPGSAPRAADVAALGVASVAYLASERQRVAQSKHLQRMMAAKRARERRFTELGPQLSAGNA